MDRLVELERKRRELQKQVQELNTQANQVSKSIGKAKDAEEREARKEEGRKLREQKDAAQGEVDELDSRIDAIQRVIPNLSHPDAPRGADDKANLELRKGKTAPPTFDFQPLDHVELAEKQDMIDFEGGGQVAGAGFYFLKNDAVLLEMALTRYAVDLLMAEGFTPTVTPDLAPQRDSRRHRASSRAGPKRKIYSIENSDLSLVATAEITLGGMLSGKTLDFEQLPLKLCGISHCFRTEAGAAGRASRGLYRVHQFTKVEMFAFTAGELAESERPSTSFVSWSAAFSTGSVFRIGSSTRRPAIWAAPRIASSTSKPGCPAAATAANTEK